MTACQAAATTAADRGGTDKAGNVGSRHPVAQIATPAADARLERKRTAEAERAQLQERLGALKKSIDRTETAKSQAVDTLAKSDAAISDATRALHDLERERADAQAGLAALTRERDALVARLAERRRQLAAVLRQHYVAGNDDRLRLLLSGEDPATIGRQLGYLGYLGRAQARMIADLKAAAAAVEVNQAEAAAASAELEDIAAQAQAQKNRLQQEQAQHAALVARLSADLARQRAETGRLQRDDNRLGAVVEQLGRLIEQQRLADEAAREKRRRLAAAKAQALAQAQARAQKKAAARALAHAGKPPSRTASGSMATPATDSNAAPTASAAAINPDAIDADEPPRTARSKIIPAEEPDATATVQEVTSGQGLAGLRGKLALPVRGELTGRFGAAREGGSGAKGIFIRAAEGTPVHAVAAGRVMFAEWLRGFGNLLIIDHGGQYLTVYGNNQAVLKHAGDSVAAGEVIARAGSTGGNEQSGLYFEMRYQGRPIDPLAWTVR